MVVSTALAFSGSSEPNVTLLTVLLLLSSVSIQLLTIFLKVRLSRDISFLKTDFFVMLS